MNKTIIWTTILTVLILAIAISLLWPKNHKALVQQNTNTQSMNTSALASPTASTQAQLALSIADFSTRITKKPFGIYITPKNSPVQPEQFTGYHTGVDVEYQDITTDVPVYAISDGVITLSETASGYGGVFILKVDINGKPRSILYGHIRPSTLPTVGRSYTKGEAIAVLGTGYSSQTDGERRHLHFGVLSDSRLDIRGYVQNKAELSGWINPVTLYP